MTFRHFQIFVMVCDEKNMTAAAARLYISQPAVSQAIAELEDYYEVRIFERLSRKLYLTEAGEILLGYARHILRMNQDAESEMRSLSRSGTIRVGASVTIGACVLPGMISAFQKQAPAFTVHVIEDNTSKIEELIRIDQLDLGLVEGEITVKEIVSKTFDEDVLVLVCGKDHAFAKRNIIDAAELETVNFILREQGSGTRKTFETVMKEHSLGWSSTWTCNNADTIKSAVAEGLGVTVISANAVRRELETGILHRLDLKGIEFKRHFKLAYHRNKYLTEGVKKFMDLVMLES